MQCPQDLPNVCHESSIQFTLFLFFMFQGWCGCTSSFSWFFPFLSVIRGSCQWSIFWSQEISDDTEKERERERSPSLWSWQKSVDDHEFFCRRHSNRVMNCIRSTVRDKSRRPAKEGEISCIPNEVSHSYSLDFDQFKLDAWYEKSVCYDLSPSFLIHLVIRYFPLGLYSWCEIPCEMTKRTWTSSQLHNEGYTRSAKIWTDSIFWYWITCLSRRCLCIQSLDIKSWRRGV